MQRNHEVLIGPREALEPAAFVIVLIGASAVGKSAIAEYVCESEIVEATPTWTTRQPRQGELDTSYDHRFVTDEEFDLLDRKGGFLDQQSLYGARYGIPFLQKPAAGLEPLIVLKPVFMPAFLEHFPHARVYQIEASADVLPLRMRARGQSQKDIDRRMELHESETIAARHFADVVFSNDGSLEETLQLVMSQIRADRQSHDARQNETLAVS